LAGVEVLRTERLVLRHLTEDDAPFVLELLNAPGFIANIGDRQVRTLEGAARYVSEGPGDSYRRHGYGLWLAALKSGEPIGICGLVRRDGLEDADIGYAFLERYWGQGFAYEAAVAVLDYARNVIGLPKVVAITSPTNAGSIAVLEKIGLRFERMIQLPGQTSESSYFTT
jgi:RimJ/RimL family protein N-acetyltransferase